MADETDPRLEEIQDRVDEVRRRLPDNPGLDVVDDTDVPAYFDDDRYEGGVSKEEAERLDDPSEHQGHAPG
jgi:hypothetical protein